MKKKDKSQGMLSPLRRAISSLQIEDIVIVGSRSSLLEDFEPKYDGRVASLSYQTKNIISGSQILQVGEGGELLFRVLNELGVRISSTEEIELDEDDPEILATVEAEIAAYYRIVDESILDDQEALDMFAMENVPYNVWPYWREFLVSQLSRMNMPKITLPFHMRPSNSTLGRESSSDD